MAVVGGRPRNNLQQHLSWFNSTKPQIPPVAQGREYTATVDTSRLEGEVPSTVPLPTVPIRQSRPVDSLGSTETMPTPANMRSTTLAAPRRSDPIPRIAEVEVISSETTLSISRNISGRSKLDRLTDQSKTLF
jgi:hypothetical protein